MLTAQNIVLFGVHCKSRTVNAEVPVYQVHLHFNQNDVVRNTLTEQLISTNIHFYCWK